MIEETRLQKELFDNDPFNFMDSLNSPLLQAGDIPKSEFRIPDLDYPLSFGSEISLRPSAMRLKEKTEMKMARPGKIESQGALVSWSRPSRIMAPQLGVGGLTPNPIKLRLASTIMAVATQRVPITKISPKILGRT